MPIDGIYRDVVRGETFATSLLMIGATLPDDVQGTPPPPPRRPIMQHFVRAGLCRAQITHNDPWRVLGCAEPGILWDAN